MRCPESIDKNVCESADTNPDMFQQVICGFPNFCAANVDGRTWKTTSLMLSTWCHTSHTNIFAYSRVALNIVSIHGDRNAALNLTNLIAPRNWPLAHGPSATCVIKAECCDLRSQTSNSIAAGPPGWILANQPTNG